MLACCCVAELDYFKDDYIVTDVPKNGDCMFACLALGTSTCRSTKDVHQVRNEIVNYMRKHPDVSEYHA